MQTNQERAVSRDLCVALKTYFYYASKDRSTERWLGRSEGERLAIFFKQLETVCKSQSYCLATVLCLNTENVSKQTGRR